MYKPISLLFLFGTALAQEATTEKVAQIASDTQKPDTGENCTTFDGEPGSCVSYYSCQDTHDFDTLGIIDIHIPVPRSCASFRDVCCKVPVTPKPIEEQQKGCGWRNPSGIVLNIKGSDSETAYGEFPWVVAIFNVDDENHYIGSGSLIDRRVVLTTAHHVVKAKKLRVRAGEWDTQTDKELYPHQNRDVDSFVVHKDFNKVLFFDVAVLFLSKPVDPAPNIGIACLPPPKQLAEPGTKCFVTGWGKDKFGTDVYQVIPRKDELSVVQHKDCRNQLRRTRLGNMFELHHTFMCANKKSTESCVGDAGSPLVCPVEFQKDRYVQNGMTAWSVGCSNDSPSVFVDVAVVRDWIDNEVFKYGIEVLEYTMY